jgi:S1-C subfamily serine protease
LFFAIILLVGSFTLALNAITLFQSRTGPGSALSHSVSPSPNTTTITLAKTIEPSVVYIDTSVAIPAGEVQYTSAGTGMIVTHSGEVLTNNHVVERATSIKIVLYGHKAAYKGKVIGVDPSRDIALLQIVSPPKDLTAVRLDTSASAGVGTPVIAIGNAFGIGSQPSVTVGSITAVNQSISASDTLSPTPAEILHGLLETNATIVPGDSGGPLVGLNGEVIGMDTAARTSNVLAGSAGYAIPINAAWSIALKIKNGRASPEIILGETAFLGVSASSSTNQKTLHGSGVVIAGVVAGSPAARAGITVGDSITAIGGKSVDSISAMRLAIRSYKPGNRIVITYTQPSSTPQTAKVILAGMPL